MERLKKLKNKTSYILMVIAAALLVLNVIQYCVNRNYTEYKDGLGGTYSLETDARGNYLSFALSEPLTFHLWVNGQVEDSGSYEKIYDGAYLLKGEEEKYYVYKKTDDKIILIYEEYDDAYSYERVGDAPYVD